MHPSAILENLGQTRRGRVGRVVRVVPGMLFYVEAPLDDFMRETYAVKLNNVLVFRDGHISPYRGESFAELGIWDGALVLVVDAERPGEPKTVVVEPAASSGYIREFASRLFR